MKPTTITRMMATGDPVVRSMKAGAGKRISAPVMIETTRRRPILSDSVPKATAAAPPQRAPIRRTWGMNFGSVPTTEIK
ncbi:hypothetical protein D3C73_1581680 [compost metagenome]